MEVDRAAYAAQRNKYNHLSDKARSNHYREKIVNAPSSKDKWAFCNKMFGKDTSSPLPAHDSEETLANDFNLFFTEKVSKIRVDLEQNPLPYPPHAAEARSEFSGTPLSNFRPVSEEEVQKVLSASPSTSCPLDPLPTKILKSCLSVFLPVLTLLANFSLSTGEFCSTFKKAFVIPLLKKSDLDQDIFKNFRPVSNLSFISKQGYIYWQGF